MTIQSAAEQFRHFRYRQIKNHPEKTPEAGMTIHDEASRRQRFGYHQTIQTQARTSHLSLIEKDVGASHERPQDQEYEKTNLRFLRNPDKTPQ